MCFPLSRRTPSGPCLPIWAPPARCAPKNLTPECFADAAVVHVEGYLLFNRELMLTALRSAKDAGALISLDLASFNVVEDARDILDDLIADFVDILIANEDEAKAYTGHSDEDKALEMLSQHVDIAALKLGPGEAGSLIKSRKQPLSPWGQDRRWILPAQAICGHPVFYMAWYMDIQLRTAAAWHQLVDMKFARLWAQAFRKMAGSGFEN